MMRHKIKKTALEYAARTGLTNYLRSIGEVPEAANARAAAMCEHARKHWESWNGQQVERNQDFCYLCILCTLSYCSLLLQLSLDTSHTWPSTSAGDPGPSCSDSGPPNADTGNSDNLDAHEEQCMDDDDLGAPSPDPPA